MKKVIVKDEKIRKNIELVKRLLSPQKDKMAVPSKESLQLVLLINKDTGVLSIKDDKTNLQPFSDEEWKEICLRLRSEGENGVCEAISGLGNDLLFQYNDLRPLAYRVMVETVSALNKALQELGNQKLALLLQDLAFMEVAVGEEVAAQWEKDLIYDTWYSVDRIEAEKLLENKPIGTFLFRKDEYATILEARLQMLYGPAIKCVTLTFLSGPEKISDRTIIAWKNRCFLFNDNLFLDGDGFLDIYCLLQSEIPGSDMNPLWNH